MGNVPLEPVGEDRVHVGNTTRYIPPPQYVNQHYNAHQGVHRPNITVDTSESELQQLSSGNSTDNGRNTPPKPVREDRVDNATRFRPPPPTPRKHVNQHYNAHQGVHRPNLTVDTSESELQQLSSGNSTDNGGNTPPMPVREDRVDNATRYRPPPPTPRYVNQHYNAHQGVHRPNLTVDTSESELQQLSSGNSTDNGGNTPPKPVREDRVDNATRYRPPPPSPRKHVNQHYNAHQGVHRPNLTVDTSGKSYRPELQQLSSGNSTDNGRNTPPKPVREDRVDNATRYITPPPTSRKHVNQHYNAHQGVLRPVKVDTQRNNHGEEVYKQKELHNRTDNGRQDRFTDIQIGHGIHHENTYSSNNVIAAHRTNHDRTCTVADVKEAIDGVDLIVKEWRDIISNTRSNENITGEQAEFIRYRMEETGQEWNRISEKMSRSKRSRSGVIENQHAKPESNAERHLQSMQTTIQDLSRQLIEYKTRIESMDQEKKELLRKIRRLEKKNKELLILNRASKEHPDRLLKNNDHVIELSDPNRPTKLAEVYSELYDNEYTEAFVALEQHGYTEREVIDTLRETLMSTYKFCAAKAAALLIIKEDAIKTLFGDDTRLLQQQPIVEWETIKRLEDQMKNIRKEVTVAIIPLVSKAYLRTRWDSDCIAELTPFIERCIFVSWMMNVQSPPMTFLALTSGPDELFDSRRYRDYRKSGKFLDYVVWPAMMLTKDGPIIVKGVAQGKN